MKNLANLLGSLTLPTPTGGVYNTDRVCIAEKVIKMLHMCFVHAGKTLTDLQILGSKLHQNVFGSQSLPGPAGGNYSAPQTP